MSAPSESLPRPFGAYELITKLGQGSQGAVYLAQLQKHAGLGPRFALKTLSVDPGPYGSGTRASLTREGRVGAVVRHPNLVQVVDAGTVDGLPFIAMELVDGCTAGMLSSDTRTLPAGAWLDLACQAALGLAALHDAGRAGGIGTALLHLDIKPSNLLIDRTGCVKLADYGLSELTARSRKKVVEGTPGYMSSEQFLGGDVDPRSDLFSLGVTLYNLLVGGRLLVSRPVGDALSSVHQLESRLDDPALWKPVEAQVPGASAVLRQCLRQEPTHRYDSAHTLWAALSQLRPHGDPGPSLAALVNEVARGDRRWHARLPPSRPFVGRLQERTRVRLAAADEPITWITGVEGIGKSVLARHALPRATWVPADDITSPEGLAQRILQVLNLSAEARLQQLLPLVPARTVVLDGLDTDAEGLVETVQNWSTTAPAWRWVVTTRGSPPASTAPAHRLELGPLSTASAAELLGRYTPGLSTDEAQEMVMQVHRHPINVEVMGRALAGGASPQDAVQSARMVGAEARRHQAALTPLEQNVLAQLLAFRGTFDVTDAEAVVKVSEDQLGRIIQHLLERGLILRSGAQLTVPPRTRMDLDAQQPAMLSTREKRALALRHAMYFSQLGSQERLAGLWGPVGHEVLERLVDARDDLQAALDAALVVRAATTAARCLIALLAVSSAGRGVSPRHTDLEAILRHRTLEPTEKVRVLLWSVIEWTQGDEDIVVGWARDALATAQGLADPRLLSAAQTTLGSILVTTRSLTDAREPIEKGLATARACGDRRAEQQALCEEARRLGRMGEFSEAIKTLDEAIELARSQQHMVDTAWLRALRALMWARMGRHLDAADALSEVAEELEVTGWWSRAAAAWGNVGFALQSRNATVAMHATTRAYRLQIQAGSVRRAFMERMRAASLMMELGRADEGERLFDEIAAEIRATGAMEHESRLVSVRIGQAVILNDWDKLGPLLDEAKRLKIVERYGGYAVLMAYSTARHALATGQEDQARAALAELRHERDLGRIQNAQWMHDDIEGRIAMAQAHYGVAEQCLERALDQARTTDPFGVCEVLRALVDVLLRNGRADRARQLVDDVTETIGPQMHPASPGRQRLQAATDRLAAASSMPHEESPSLPDFGGLFDQETMVDPGSQA